MFKFLRRKKTVIKVDSEWQEGLKSHNVPWVDSNDEFDPPKYPTWRHKSKFSGMPIFRADTMVDGKPYELVAYTDTVRLFADDNDGYGRTIISSELNYPDMTLTELPHHIQENLIDILMEDAL